MYRILSDLRLLRLALYLEDTLEGYEDSLRSTIPLVAVRAKLRKLFEAGPAHRRLRELHTELAGQFEAVQATADEEDILQAILECEKIAHNFYLHNLDAASDPALVDLFHQLADEEASHVRTVQDAIDLMHSYGRALAARPR